MAVKNLLLMVIFLAAFSAPFAGAGIVTAVDIIDYLVFSRLIDDSLDPFDDNAILGITNLLKTRLDIKSDGNKNVKAQFQLDAMIIDDIGLYMEESSGFLVLTQDDIILDIPRAYIKVKFPGFMATLGKTRVSWGEGFMFNAGDVIFGGMSLDVDISQSVLRDETEILASAYIPLGDFSYIEAVFFPFPALDEVIPGTLVPLPRNAAETSAGCMISGNIYDVSFEAGYLYKGVPQSHKPFIAAHGHLFADWYMAASCDIPYEDADADAFKQGLALSGGVFGIISLENDATLNLRLETGIFPFGEWEEWDAEEEGAPYPPGPYGIYFFPEVVYAPVQNMSFQLRSLVSPVDASGIVIAGMNWNIYQGFTLGFMASAMFGDGDDLFGWERDSDLAFVLSMEYVFGE